MTVHRGLLFLFMTVVLIIRTESVVGDQVISQQQLRMSFSPVVKQVAHAVVNIYTRKIVRDTLPIFNDSFFRHFFGNQMGLSQERVQRSLGSGVIVRSNGIIVTNNHVIRDSDEIIVVLSDRREFEATLIGADERTDLAILKINTGNQKLPVLELGDSDVLEIGDVVLAIGNPFGVGQTVTMGIVSALARTTVGGSDVRSFIQIDAAINPGNSGGALVDLQGRLVGINSTIFSSNEGGGSVGIGFAIPSTMVNAVLTDIIRIGRSIRPWLGVSVQQVTSEMFQTLKLDHPHGVLINEIQQGSPAERAKIKIGDVIVAVNDHNIDDPETLRFRIATLNIENQTQLTIFRNGQKHNVVIKLEIPPEIPPRDTSMIIGNNPFAGIILANMNPALAEELGIEYVKSGVTVIRIKHGTIASNLQFQPGDVIVKVNDQIVTLVSKLKALLNNSHEKKWVIMIQRSGKIFTLTVGG
ncbi:MAG: Do family serine endopeptidase [Rhodospirillaceae bacterium]|jgi:serine protease Do|nr:Do family serine endopeptidase [Rhodospirillaceae bacterium]